MKCSFLVPFLVPYSLNNTIICDSLHILAHVAPTDGRYLDWNSDLGEMWWPTLTLPWPHPTTSLALLHSQYGHAWCYATSQPASSPRELWHERRDCTDTEPCRAAHCSLRTTHAGHGGSAVSLHRQECYCV